MTRQLSDIKPQAQAVVEIFVRELLARQKDNVLKIILFGSVARGDDNEDSDIDVFLLLKENSFLGKIGKDIVRSASIADDAVNYETYTSPLAMSVDEFNNGERIGLPVVKNIKREGVVLYDIGSGR